MFTPTFSSQTTDISVITVLLGKHVALWSEADEAKRTPVAAEIYTEDIYFVDPFFVVSGQAQISSFIADLLRKHPGYVFRITGSIEAHHNVAYLSWQFGPPDTPAAITGHDVFVLADERIQQIYTFINGVTASTGH